MIYLTFDSNIWIYFLDESYKEENSLDYLEHWIEAELVSILVPNVITEEWNRNKKENKDNRKIILGNFFSMAEEILPSSFFEEYKKPDVQDRIVEDQFERIEKLISAVEVIHLSVQVSQHVIRRGIEKLAPLHKNKNSVADAVIILSLFEYAESNPGHQFYFLSNNTTDFYEKINGKQKIHPHLANDFERLSIKDYRNIQHLMHDLKNLLPVTIDIQQRKKDRIRQKLGERIYSPKYEKYSGVTTNSFIENKRIIDSILKGAYPTIQMVPVIESLLKEDPAYEAHFFRNLKNPVWLPILLQMDVFNPVNNPEPVAVKDGFQIPGWEPLQFLEHLSQQMKEGKSLAYVDDLLSIIRRVSQSPRDNYRTWYMVISILTNIPNERVPFEILHYIPIWLTGRFQASLQSSKLTAGLLPKFLTGKPADAEKAELIFRHLIALHKEPRQASAWDGKRSYTTNVDLVYLHQLLRQKEVVTKLASLCTEKALFDVAENLKRILLDFPSGINLKLEDDQTVLEIKLIIQEKNLVIQARKKDAPDDLLEEELRDYEQYEEEELLEKLHAFFSSNKISYQPTEENTFHLGLVHNLFSGYSHSLNLTAIHQLEKKSYSRELDVTYAMLLKELLSERVKAHPESATSIVDELCYDRSFRLPFFRRMALYTITEHWDVLNRLFWKSPDTFFHSYEFEKELYRLLKQTNQTFSAHQLIQIDRILQAGPQLVEKDDPDYWQLRWLSALKEHPHFQSRYEALSAKRKLTNQHYEEIGVTKWRSGSQSPLTIADLLEMDHEQIVSTILSFHLTDRWQEPSVSGLAETAGKAVAQQPEFFAEGLVHYTKVYYIYAYHIINGFRDAWKEKKTFPWEPVLRFCLDYIHSSQFQSGELSIKTDSWGATKEWVEGAIGTLISECTNDDDHAIEASNLPTVKQLLLQIVEMLEPVDISKESMKHFPTYTLNSTAGKVLRALLDYTLHRARTQPEPSSTDQMEPDVKAAFEKALAKQIIDSYVMLGMYYEQFAYLNKSWIKTNLALAIDLPDSLFQGFFGGLSFANPPGSDEFYPLLYPAYQRALGVGKMDDSSLESNPTEHLVHFLFWGFDQLGEESLLRQYVRSADADNTVALITYIWQQEMFVYTLEKEQRTELEASLVRLWALLAEREEEKVIRTLPVLLVFITELNEEITTLLVASRAKAGEHQYTSELLENLVKLKGNGEPKQTALYLSKIVNAIFFTAYLLDDDKERIKELVRFIYENGEKEVANEICNKASREGYEFLNDLYDKYNS